MTIILSNYEKNKLHNTASPDTVEYVSIGWYSYVGIGQDDLVEVSGFLVLEEQVRHPDLVCLGQGEVFDLTWGWESTEIRSLKRIVNYFWLKRYCILEISIMINCCWNHSKDRILHWKGNMLRNYARSLYEKDRKWIKNNAEIIDFKCWEKLSFCKVVKVIIVNITRLSKRIVNTYKITTV